LSGYSRVRCPSIEQLSASSRSSSIPPTPAPTPNPLLHVHMVHEQLVAGIKQLRADEGYVDSTSFPATPAPSPFSPSPAQNVVPSPAQVAEGIQRLRDEDRQAVLIPSGGGGFPAFLGGGGGGAHSVLSSSLGSGVNIPGVLSGSFHQSGASTGQPPTPSSTPGLAGPGGGAGGAAAAGFGGVNQLGIIPEHLAESIHQHLRCQDEGLDSTSSPGTPVPTPLSPSFSHHLQQQGKVLPEQLVAGIHRLKVEEGMSSGGSSGFPSTPAPTPFSHHPGGVRPEDLAAGISRLSVIGEADVAVTGCNNSSNSGGAAQTGCNNSNTTTTHQQQHKQLQQQQVSINVMSDQQQQPSLSQYFSSPAPIAAATSPAAVTTTADQPQSLPAQHVSKPADHQAQTFFDQLGSEELAPASQQQLAGDQVSKSADQVSESADQVSKSADQVDQSAGDQVLKSADQVAEKSAEQSAESADNGQQQLVADEDCEKPSDASVLHSCRASRVDLPQSLSEEAAEVNDSLKSEAVKGEAKLDVVEQKFEDEMSLQRMRRQSSAEMRRSISNSEAGDQSGEPVVCTIFSEKKPSKPGDGSASSGGEADPFDTIAIGRSSQLQVRAAGDSSAGGATSSARKSPSSLNIQDVATSAAPSNYATPVAPTPVNDPSFVPPPPATAMVGGGGAVAQPAPVNDPLIVPPPPPRGVTVTPIAPQQASPGYSTHVAPPPTALQSNLLSSSALQQDSSAVKKTNNNLTSTPSNHPPPPQMMMPITSPLPSAQAAPQPQLRHDDLRLHQEGAGDQDEDDDDYDRASSAWIPCAATAETLANMAASFANGNGFSFQPERYVLTLPGVQVREDLLDPVRNLVGHYRGESEAAKRDAHAISSADSVSQDMRGLRQLIKAGYYRAAVNLTARLLQAFKQGLGQVGSLSKHSTLSLKLWYIRFSMLVRLKQYSMVEVEAEAFGDLDRPDLYHEFYPQQQPDQQPESRSIRTGSMVPFGFRLLLAELPQHLNKHHETIDRLHALLSVIRKILANLDSGKMENGEPPASNNSTATAAEATAAESRRLWKRREIQVLHSLANCALMQKDYEMAVTTLETIFKMESGDANRQTRIQSSLGRVYLQLGDVTAAAACFAQAKALFDKLGSASSNDDENGLLALELRIDQAFLRIAGNSFEEALAILREANSAFPDNATVINNMAVCLLYTGKLSEAIGLLESNLTQNPTDFLRETQVLNLATLYELESSYASQKKQSLLDFMSRYSGDGANVSCLKF